MDHKNDYEENIPDEAPDPSHFEDEENPWFTNGLSEESDSIASDILPNEDCAITIENVSNEISSVHATCGRNGEESNEEIEEGKYSSDDTQAAEEATDSKNDCDHILMGGSWLPNLGKKMDDQHVRFSDFKNVPSSNQNYTSNSGTEKNLDVKSEMILLNDAIEKAIHQHLNTSDSTDMKIQKNNDERGNDVREVSVQTAQGNISVFDDFCPVCKLETQKSQNRSNLRALCLEYPPYKKRKISNGLNGIQGTSENGFYMVDKNFEQNEGSSLKQKTVSSDHAAPKNVSQNEIFKVPSTLRVGLSKRAKLRPLHQQPKFQVMDSPGNSD